MKNSKIYTINDLAKASGAHLSTVRYHAKKMKWQNKQKGWSFTQTEFENRLAWLRISTTPGIQNNPSKK